MRFFLSFCQLHEMKYNYTMNIFKFLSQTVRLRPLKTYLKHAVWVLYIFTMLYMHNIHLNIFVLIDIDVTPELYNYSISVILVS